MTPVIKQVGHTVLRMERKKVTEVSGPVHEAGGDHKGIIINKSVDGESESSLPFTRLFITFQMTSSLFSYLTFDSFIIPVTHTECSVNFLENIPFIP